MDVSQKLMDGMQLNLLRQHWKRTKSSLCLMICTTFQGHSRSWIKIATMEWFGWQWGGGFCFLSKDWVFPLLFDIVGQVKLSLKRFSVLLYDMPKPNIYRILSKDNQVIYTLDTIYHDTSSRASPDILFSSNSFRDILLTNAQIFKGPQLRNYLTEIVRKLFR